MPEYTLIDPVTGQQTSLHEAELTRNLRQDWILLRDQEHVGIIIRRDLVVFARWCAGETLNRLVDEPDQRVTHALSLVDRWLEDEKSLTSEELEDAAAWAAEAANAGAARAAAWAAAWAAANAAWAAEAANAARAAANAARAAANAAQAAARAAGATGATGATWAASYEAQAQWFVQHLQSGK